MQQAESGRLQVLPEVRGKADFGLFPVWAKLPPDPDLRFCPVCGAEVAATRRGAVAEPDSPAVKALHRLAPKQYAQRLLAAGGEARGERRIVTVLFSDVKGSTSMAEDLDPEDVLDIMSGAFDVLIEPVYRYEGTLARLMGDAINVASRMESAAEPGTILITEQTHKLIVPLF